jgi:hypothetical protein
VRTAELLGRAVGGRERRNHRGCLLERLVRRSLYCCFEAIATASCKGNFFPVVR